MALRSSLALTLLALGCAAQSEPPPDGERAAPSDEESADDVDDGQNDITDCEFPLQVLDCLTPQGYEGNQYCEIGDDGYVLTECVMNVSTTGTPLVLAFDRQPVTFTHASGNFDLFGVAAQVESAWVEQDTPWLAFDRNENGSIDDGSELFGSMTLLSSGERAAHGFQALAELDRDHDGFVTEKDEAFSRLVLWHDKNQDRASTPDELSSLADWNIVALELEYERQPRCAPEGCERERARFFFETAAGVRQGSLVDVHLFGRF